jgi:hypothetical protein
MAVKTALAFEDDDESKLIRRMLKWVNEPNYALGDVPEFRPTLRPSTPILTVLDDGSMEKGEEVRVRQETLTIGRTSGDVRIPHDPSISAPHAEIRRSPWLGGFQWHLHDLDSVNGTFVMTGEAVLHDDAIIILGSRRFRLRDPLKPKAAIGVVHDTGITDGNRIPKDMSPVLVEASAKPGALAFALRSDRLVIGRTGGGADIELDDPLLDDRHAELTFMQDGTWTITSEGTKNGIWVSISTTLLAPLCYFRCGEQRFRFVIP